jgi:hypothetical protein
MKIQKMADLSTRLKLLDIVYTNAPLPGAQFILISQSCRA